MQHEELAERISGYADGELTVNEAREVESHLASCEACAARLARHRALSAAVHAELPALAAPDALRDRVRAAVRDAAGPGAGHRPRSRSWGPLAYAAVLLIAVAATWQLRAGRAGDERVAEEVLASHVRSLMANHLVDVASTDRHNVKPWFAGKLDFSPQVANPAPDSFPLVGGRLDYLAGRPVAAVVYRRRQHVINLFEWPVESGNGSSSAPPAGRERQGYHLIGWSTDGMRYCAVSDLAETDLRGFVQMLRGAD